MNFEELTSMRECGYEGVDEFLWVTKDKGAYGNEKDGPLFDWISDSKNFMSRVDKFDVVVQAGGNCGMYPRFYKNYFKEVYTFEPDALNFYCLDKNCVGKGYHKYFGGLGNTTDKLSIQQKSSINVGMHVIKENPGNVQMYRIDDLKLSTCDLIHLDVEGYETKAILGAEDTIRKFNPVVITERSGGEADLKRLGYEKYKKLRMDTIYIKV